MIFKMPEFNGMRKTERIPERRGQYFADRGAVKNQTVRKDGKGDKGVQDNINS